MSATTNRSGDTIRAVDLFCGAGGLSWALVTALMKVAIEANEPTEEFIADRIDLVAVNHWDRAIETHEQNHPWARHYHDDIAHVNPREVFDEDDPDVTILSGGIECTHWSTARGGKPVSEQKRMPAWDFLTWVQKLRPRYVLVENVPEFQKWGPIDDEGTPTRTGDTFKTWVDALHSLGYSVDWEVLNAADYGDATQRKRLFVMATREGRPEFPAPTHSEDGGGDTEPWRTAADIIDWSDRGGSIWTRDLENARVRPLKYTTMRRIAEGLRRHCDDRLEPFADALEWIGRVDAGDEEKVDTSKITSVEELRERVVPAWFAPTAAALLDEPFLVERPPATPTTPFLSKYYGTSTARPVDAPVDTITSGGQKYGVCTPYVLSQHSSGIPRAASERPVPTVTAGSRGIAVSSPSAFVMGQHSNAVLRSASERPVPTVTTDGNVHFVAPETFCLRQQSGGVPSNSDDPLPTISGGGAIGKVESLPLVMPRNGAMRDLYSNPLYEPDSRPLHTVTAKNTDGYLVTPSLIRYSHGGASLSPADPMPTIGTEKGGVFALSDPYLCPLYNGRVGQRPRTRDVDRPLMTVPASKVPAGVARPEVVPFIDDCQGAAASVGEPLGTAVGKDRFGLVVPECYPWGLDIRYRMLQPHELAAAQGFPSDYEFAGTKSDVTEQIGNAVPVNLAQSLVESLLSSELPSLTDYVDDEPVPATDSPGRAGVADD